MKLKINVMMKQIYLNFVTKKKTDGGLLVHSQRIMAVTFTFLLISSDKSIVYNFLPI